MKGKRLLTQTRLEALVILGAVAVYIWEGLDIPQYYSLPGVPGPTLFPVIIGSAMAGAALWLLIFPGRLIKEKARSSPADRLRGLRTEWRFFLMWGLLIAYVFLLPLLGFLICSAVLLTAFFFLLGERRWYFGISIACAFSLGIYLLFTKALQINLPMGILEVVLRP